jgi:hypothetical protein
VVAEWSLSLRLPTPLTLIGGRIGQRDLAVTANTYTHVLNDETELDYAAMAALHGRTA